MFYSDSCSGQNKNQFYATMLWYALNNFHLSSIEHKYLEKGHNQNENDSIHAAIETSSRFVSVFTTAQWVATKRAARPRHPYTCIVKEMDLENIIDFKFLAGNVRNFDLDTDCFKIRWS